VAVIGVTITVDKTSVRAIPLATQPPSTTIPIRSLRAGVSLPVAILLSPHFQKPKMFPKRVANQSGPVSFRRTSRPVGGL
jgi:hypothetical protein